MLVLQIAQRGMSSRCSAPTSICAENGPVGEEFLFPVGGHVVGREASGKTAENPMDPKKQLS